MLAAALLLMLIAVLLVVGALFGGGDAATLDLGPFNLETNATAVFFLGMATLLFFVIALMLFRSAGRRAASRRRDRKKVGELSEKLQEFERGRTDDEQPTGG